MVMVSSIAKSIPLPHTLRLHEAALYQLHHRAIDRELLLLAQPQHLEHHCIQGAALVAGETIPYMRAFGGGGGRLDASFAAKAAQVMSYRCRLHIQLLGNFLCAERTCTA